jgi:hypothetical protein
MCFVDPAHKVYHYLLRMDPRGLKHVAVYSVNSDIDTYKASIGFLRKIVSLVQGYG